MVAFRNEAAYRTVLAAGGSGGVEGGRELVPKDLLGGVVRP